MNLALAYFEALQKIDNQQITEHSLRKPLQTLLEAMTPKDTTILHEPKRQGKFGAPDFKISTLAGVIGYCETKKVGENLDEVLKTPQIKKYLELNNNLLLTDYCTFIWLKGEIEVERLVFCKPEAVGEAKSTLEVGKAEALEVLVGKFFRETPQGVNNAEELARALAIRTRTLKEFLETALKEDDAETKTPRLFGLYQVFKQLVAGEFLPYEFADSYAQMLTYGLFLAKLNAEAQTVTLKNTQDFIPQSFELIRELTLFLRDLEDVPYQGIRWVLEEILTILNYLDLKAIQESLSFNKHTQGSKKTNALTPEGSPLSADPYLYFYEDFLGQYDPALKAGMGVYYTPPQVVNFIVRAVDEVLQKTFGIKQGLADADKVTVLDFATGTGTFVLEVLKVIFDKIPQNATKRPLIVQNHILKNIYGFEFLMAPYMVAYLKLSQFLHENGYEFTGKDRLQIYLTNTLEPMQKQVNYLLPALTKENNEAQRIKESPILVITGNPPYNGESKNKSKWILEKMKDYKLFEGKRKETNTKWVQNDYVKFIRFAEDKMQQVKEGMVAVITSHSFLDAPTFRIMRKSLLTTFDQIYIIDLHGNVIKKEKSPDGSKDQGVFDIKEGTCISIFIKSPKLKKNASGLASLYHTDLYGTRKSKFDVCAGHTLGSIGTVEILPTAPFYLLRPQDTTHLEQYDKGWSVKDIFMKNALGVFTHRDYFLVDASESNLRERIKKFSKAEDVRRAVEWFGLKDTRDWKIKKALEQIQNEDIDIQKYAFRPFDDRFVCYNQCLYDRGTSRFNIMKDFIPPSQNLALVSVRNCQGVAYWEHTFVTDKIADAHLIPTGAYVFPLYRYDDNKKDDTQTKILDENGKKANFTKEFKAFILQHFANYETNIQSIFNYIYAILHAPTYREKYIEFLKMDFPKIPFTEDFVLFEQVADLGGALIEAHLLQTGTWEDLPVGEPMELHHNTVEEVRYKAPQPLKGEKEMESNANLASGRLYYNEKQYFDNVTPNVWQFKVGGYQVLDKYLKDRKGQDIFNELPHIQRIIQSLAYTVDKMQEIDALVGDWI